MLQATTNNTKFEITENENGLVIDGNPLSWDLVKIDENYFHIVYNNKSYRAEVVRVDHAHKNFYA